MRVLSSCGEWGLLFLAGHGFLIAVASLCCRARALGTRASVVVACRLSSCGTRAQLLHGMWDLPGPGIEPVSPALAGRFLTTAPSGKSRFHTLNPQRQLGHTCHNGSRFKAGIKMCTLRDLTPPGSGGQENMGSVRR